MLNDRELVEICLKQMDPFGRESLKKELVAMQLENLLEMPDARHPQLFLEELKHAKHA